MPARIRSRTNKSSTRRGEMSAVDNRSADKDKLREHLLAMILRSEAARKQARR